MTSRPLSYLRRQWIARPLAVFSVCFLLGILFGKAVPYGLAISVIPALGSIILSFHLKKSIKRTLFILPMVTAFLIGNAHMQAAHFFNPPVPEVFSVPFSGTVASDPIYRTDTQRIVFEFQLDRIDGQKADSKVRLYLRSDVMELTGIEYGQYLECFGHIWPQDSATNPFQYDAMNGLRADGLSGMAAAKLEDVIVTPARPDLGRLLVHLRRCISKRIQVLFPENAELVQAFVLGDRNNLDEEMREAFNHAGVTHLICISGLHISTLASVVSRLLRLRFSYRTAVFGTIIAVLLYGILIGFPSSLVRAAIMFAVFSVAPIAGRPSDPISRLSAALLIMLLLNPFYVYDGGFVLSFAASAGILLLTEPIEYLLRVDKLRSLKPHPHPVRRMLQRISTYFPLLLCTTLAAQLATLPAVIRYFGSQPLLSIPVNLLAIPLAMLAYPLALAALVLSTVSLPLGMFAAQLPEFLFSLLTHGLEALKSIHFVSLRAPVYPSILLAAHWIALILASGLNRIAIHIRRFIPLALVALVFLSMLNAWVDTLGFKVIFLDAGQADAVVVKAEGNVFLFDVGDSYSPAADYVSGACLGVDAVFLSHPHYDHAAGLTELLENMPPKHIYVPEGWFDVEADESVSAAIQLAQEMDIPITELSPGMVLCPSQNVEIRIGASSDPHHSVNDLSMLIELRCYDRSVYFTGDLSDKCEPEILPDVDILKVPHHGSNKATTERFLSQTTPEISVITVGDNNYGHPGDGTLSRLAAAGSDIYRTDQHGAVTIRIRKSGEMSVKTYLPTEE